MEKQPVSQVPFCMVCKDLLVSPIIFPCCKAIVCSQCYSLTGGRLQTACKHQKAQPEPYALNTKKISLQCINPHCSVTNLDYNHYSQHVYKQCDFIEVVCPICPQKLIKKHLIEHCQANHPDKFLEYIIEQLPGQLEQYRRLENTYRKGGKGVQQLKQAYTNDRGRTARRGETGKLYCGGGMEVAGCGCDGSCGPNNGCSCLSCMRLELKIRNLEGSNCLINNRGALTRIQKGVPYCGKRITHGTDEYCSLEQRCHDCESLLRHKMLQKYNSLLS